MFRESESIARGLQGSCSSGASRETAANEEGAVVEVCRGEVAGFVRSVLHELRCPLNVLSGFTELLDDEKTGTLNESQRKCVEQIERSTRDLILVLDELQDYSRLQDNHFPMAWEPFELAPVVDGCLKGVESLAYKRRVQTERVGSGAVRSDPRVVRQLFATVIKNCLQFTPPGGMIRVRIEARPDEEVLVLIEDTGETLAEGCGAYRPECFGPTTKTSGPMTRVGHSRQVSLGMRLARELALRCGTTFATGPRIGGGAELRFSFKTATGGREDRDADKATACAAAGGGF